MTDPVVLRQRIAPGSADAVAELVREQLECRDGATVGALVPEDGVSTASLFVERTTDATDSLVWYVEVEDAESHPWTDPVTAVVRGSPLFDAGLGDLLDTPDSARVYSGSSNRAAVLVHAHYPDRPKSTEARTDALPAFLSSADAGPTPDVVLIRARVRPGWVTRFVRALAGLTDRLDDDGWVERKFEDWTEPVLEEEGMWTESLFLERTDGDCSLLWYMEAEDMKRVGEAYYETSNLVARISEVVLGRILEDPATVLDDPVTRSDFDLLAHAVASDRP